MKLSAKADYACIAVLELAKNHKRDQPVSISTIAENQGISETFLVHIMKDLKEAGLVTSTRGAKGGYKLAKSPENTSVAEVIEAIEGQMIDLKCMHTSDETRCELEPTCEIQSIWDVVKYRIISVLDDMSFREIMDLVQQFDSLDEQEDEEEAVARDLPTSSGENVSGH